MSNTIEQRDVAKIPGVNRIRELIGQSGEAGWDLAWKESMTPWDLGEMQKPLRDLLESDRVPFPTVGKAIVPGCGRGYEAVYIAGKLGLEVVGMDISPTAVEAAKANLATSNVPSGARVKFELASFFELPSPKSDNDAYDLAFDYTFFVAVPLDLRAVWGTQMTALVKSGGYLIALVWPIDGDRPGGPPYSVKVADYEAVLPQGWTKILDEPTDRPERVNTERIVVWRRN
ncbi:S-adenosyl-L-methionine-dependent methyltransferase [Sistotremastrum suecicum HHB10207 ss-3]|uniref:S-adenosyl-L-methionine-dependent methyltransferase n=1 Tax=Sistotremastrum suecicum HHB10207 ss-3 TaxID=1314776 RepID=A0A166DWP2_9AGAM|nr:S-adenosyl-L-methionine-dependent methyltransferase [Sistotremastrum suecicum HHB10207 ss-3]